MKKINEIKEDIITWFYILLISIVPGIFVFGNIVYLKDIAVYYCSKIHYVGDDFKYNDGTPLWMYPLDVIFEVSYYYNNTDILTFLYGLFYMLTLASFWALFTTSIIYLIYILINVFFNPRIIFSKIGVLLIVGIFITSILSVGLIISVGHENNLNIVTKFFDKPIIEEPKYTEIEYRNSSGEITTNYTNINWNRTELFSHTTFREFKIDFWINVTPEPVVYDLALQMKNDGFRMGSNDFNVNVYADDIGLDFFFGFKLEEFDKNGSSKVIYRLPTSNGNCRNIPNFDYSFLHGEPLIIESKIEEDYSKMFRITFDETEEIMTTGKGMYIIIDDCGGNSNYNGMEPKRFKIEVV